MLPRKASSSYGALPAILIAAGALLFATDARPASADRVEAASTEAASTEAAAEVIATEVAKTVFYSKATVREVAQRHRKALMGCFETVEALGETPAGRFVVEFQIGREGGKPIGVKLIENTREGSPVGPCIVSHFEQMEFDPPGEEGIALARYPFEYLSPTDPRVYRPLGGPGVAPYSTTLSDRIRYRGERPKLVMQGAAGAGDDGVARLEGRAALGVTEWFELRLSGGELDRPLTGAPRYAAGFRLASVGKHRAGNGLGIEMSYGWDTGDEALTRLRFGLLASDSLASWLQADFALAILFDSGPVDERVFAPAVRLGLPIFGDLSTFLEGSIHLRPKVENRAIAGAGLSYLLSEGLVAGAGLHAGNGQGAPIFRLSLASDLSL